ncbi:hypothetical protein NDU88_004651 [Pleurodeles waltl]|uniref:Uncharacterized protein n=1 Tax=Pleurodeles waltl TaxID=8319 RepID=A0AAV7PI64_PLEWA|nr:hypothetical protein NDU88_004651 [Pleurodeles waltl]
MPLIVHEAIKCVTPLNVLHCSSCPNINFLSSTRDAHTVQQLRCSISNSCDCYNVTDAREYDALRHTAPCNEDDRMSLEYLNVT